MIRQNKNGQNAIEYMLVFAVVVIVGLIATMPGGFLTNNINQSIDISVQGLGAMAGNVNLNVYNGF